MLKTTTKANNKNVKEAPIPVWFDKNLEKSEISDEEAKELEELLKI